MRQAIDPGTVIAGYRLESLLAEGATGAVYLARDTQGGAVALKLLAPELARDERFRARFLRETELVGELDHPHVVTVLASGEADGFLYLARRQVVGVDLRELLRREGPLEPGRAVALVGQVAEALDAACSSTWRPGCSTSSTSTSFRSSSGRRAAARERRRSRTRTGQGARLAGGHARQVPRRSLGPLARYRQHRRRAA
jgi:serine/threonine protein kinase